VSIDEEEEEAGSIACVASQGDTAQYGAAYIQGRQRASSAARDLSPCRDVREIWHLPEIRP